MRQLKICMVTSFYPPFNFGGDGVFTQRLARALAKDGHDVHVIYDQDAYTFCAKSTPSEKVSEPAGITVHSLGVGTPNKLDILLAHQLGRPVGKRDQLQKLLDQDFDVIHFHNISLLGGPDVLELGKGTKLCTLHDHWFVCAMHVLWKYDREACTERSCLSCTIAGKRPPQLWRYTGAVAEAAKHVGAFIAPSEFARQSHIANGFPAPIKVLSHFMPDDQIDQPYQSQSRTPYFLFVGRLEKLKGVQFLIEQFKKFDQAELLIAGTGLYESELKELASGLKHVHFVGKVPTEQLNGLYRGAIAVLVPSLCFETFGLVALEGFAQRTPALVNQLGALPEVVQGGGGLTYSNELEFISALQKLQSDRAFRNKMGEEGFANLKTNYTEKRHLSEYYGMIADLDYSKSRQKTK